MIGASGGGSRDTGSGIPHKLLSDFWRPCTIILCCGGGGEYSMIRRVHLTQTCIIDFRVLPDNFGLRFVVDVRVEVVGVVGVVRWW